MGTRYYLVRKDDENDEDLITGWLLDENVQHFSSQRVDKCKYRDTEEAAEQLKDRIGKKFGVWLEIELIVT